mmetsp:Transcript_82076/g.214136  ORF Transcript_82076/g.214136 Transcript_82076/m.214136 type:complete len:219 (-) Transcript_82076:298-954(-)
MEVQLRYPICSQLYELEAQSGLVCFSRDLRTCFEQVVPELRTLCACNVSNLVGLVRNKRRTIMLQHRCIAACTFASVGPGLGQDLQAEPLREEPQAGKREVRAGRGGKVRDGGVLEETLPALRAHDVVLPGRSKPVAVGAPDGRQLVALGSVLALLSVDDLAGARGIRTEAGVAWTVEVAWPSASMPLAAAQALIFLLGIRAARRTHWQPRVGNACPI